MPLTLQEQQELAQLQAELNPPAVVAKVDSSLPSQKFIDFNRKVYGIGPVADSKQYSKFLNVDIPQENALNFYKQYEDWQIKDVIDNPKIKTSSVTLVNPKTNEIQNLELTGDKNVRTFNPGNVGTDTFRTGLGKGLFVKDIFKPIETKVLESKTKFPLITKKNDTELKTLSGTKKRYADKTLWEFVQTYLPRYNKSKESGSRVIEENSLSSQKSYLNALQSAIKNIQPNFNIDTGKINELSPEAKNILLKTIFKQEGGKLQAVKVLTK